MKAWTSEAPDYATFDGTVLLPFSNRETVREFITTIAAQAKAALSGIKAPDFLQISRLHPTSENLVSSRYTLDDGERMIEDAVGAANAGHNVYVEARTIREDAARGNGRGKLEDTAAVFALVIDSDADRQMGWEPNGAASPSLSVETSPGNFQFWFFLRDAVPADMGKRLGERLRAATGADHDTGTITQPYRVAGTPNYPNKNKRARGRVTVPTYLKDFNVETLWTKEQIEQAFPMPKNKANGSGNDGGNYGAQPNEGSIPPDTMRVIREGVEEGKRSHAFFNVVRTLKRHGFTAKSIFALLDKYPDGIASKYIGRLCDEVERVYNKIKIDPKVDPPGPEVAEEAPAEPSKTNDGAACGFTWTLLSPGEENDMPRRKWLVDEVLPETGVALISGQWGLYKTFTAFDLICAVMSGGNFIQFPVARQGGVLLLATEGHNEVDLRLAAAWKHHGGDERPPFVWVVKSPRLLNDNAETILIAMIKHAEAKLKREFELPLALVVIDALGKAVGYSKSGDENDAATTKKVMRALEQAAFATGVLVVGVTHFGKQAETGTRGSSVFEDDVDTVLALIGERDKNGALTDPRLCLRKRRAGPPGDEFPINTHGVTIGSEGTLVMDWSAADQANQGKAAKGGNTKKDPWSKKKSLRSLRKALMNVLADQGREMRPWPNGPSVRAVDIEIVRQEFYRSYPAAEGTDAKSKQAARQQAFRRAINDADAANLIKSWEIEGVTYVWLVDPVPPHAQAQAKAKAQEDDLL